MGDGVALRRKDEIQQVYTAMSSNGSGSSWNRGTKLRTEIARIPFSCQATSVHPPFPQKQHRDWFPLKRNSELGNNRHNWNTGTKQKEGRLMGCVWNKCCYQHPGQLLLASVPTSADWSVWNGRPHGSNTGDIQHAADQDHHKVKFKMPCNCEKKW